MDNNIREASNPSIGIQISRISQGGHTKHRREWNIPIVLGLSTRIPIQVSQDCSPASPVFWMRLQIEVLSPYDFGGGRT